jgi:hypothetical protein
MSQGSKPMRNAEFGLRNDLDGTRMKFWETNIFLDKGLNFLYSSIIVIPSWFIYQSSIELLEDL